MEAYMNEKRKGPKKGAGRRLAARLKELAEKNPPDELVKKINETNDNKKVAKPTKRPVDLDI